MDTATINNINFIFDFVLVAASIWMIIAVRGVGGLVGRTLNLIVIGAIILGAAHLIADLVTRLGLLESAPNQLVHRIIVLIGFIVLIVGFRQIRTLTR